MSGQSIFRAHCTLHFFPFHMLQRHIYEGESQSNRVLSAKSNTFYPSKLGRCVLSNFGIHCNFKGVKMSFEIMQPAQDFLEAFSSRYTSENITIKCIIAAFVSSP